MILPNKINENKNVAAHGFTHTDTHTHVTPDQSHTSHHTVSHAHTGVTISQKNYKQMTN